MDTEFAKINPNGLQYLLDAMCMDQAELEQVLGCTEPLVQKDAQGAPTIAWAMLRRMDEEIFRRGPSFCVIPWDPPRDAKESIFYRRGIRGLSFADRVAVYRMEDDFRRIKLLHGLAKMPPRERQLPVYSLADAPEEVAGAVRDELLPKNSKTRRDRDFLQALVNRLGSRGILVVEFLEGEDEMAPSSLEGMCLDTEIGNIALKRQRHRRERNGCMKRQIFTCAHLLGHHLLREDGWDRDILAEDVRANKVELWCNRFALHFLAPADDLGMLRRRVRGGKQSLDDPVAQGISRRRHLSRCALFFHLADRGAISWQEYGRLRGELQQRYDAYEARRPPAGRGEDAQKSRRRVRPLRSKLEREIYLKGYSVGAVSICQLRGRINPTGKEMEEAEAILTTPA